MLKQVPTVRTNFSNSELIKALIEGWRENYNNQLPKKEQIGVIYSQWALETGKGSSCWNNNLGNYKAVNDPSDPNKIIEYCALNGVWEIINGKRVVLSSDNPGAWFRAFPTLKDGVTFHIDEIKNKRYKAAWVAVEAGDPAQFAHILKINRYYTAPEADYIKGMQNWFNKYMKDNTFEEIIDELNPPTIPAPPKVPSIPNVNPTGFFDKIKGIFNK